MKVTREEAAAIMSKWGPIRQYALTAVICVFYLVIRLSTVTHPPQLVDFLHSVAVSAILGVSVILAALVFITIGTVIRYKIEGIMALINPIGFMAYDDYAFRPKFYIPVLIVIVTCELLLLITRAVL